jgi:hypothetical protein
VVIEMEVLIVADVLNRIISVPFVFFKRAL